MGKKNDLSSIIIIYVDCGFFSTSKECFAVFLTSLFLFPFSYYRNNYDMGICLRVGVKASMNRRDNCKSKFHWASLYITYIVPYKYKLVN